MAKEIYIAGAKYDYVSASYEETVDPDPDNFDVVLPQKYTIADDAQVLFKRDGANVFSGIAEKKVLGFGESGEEMKLSGRSSIIRLIPRVTGREVYEVEPADTAKSLLQPSEDLATAGWTATASVNNGDAPKAIDRNYSTWWSTSPYNQTTGQWIKVDMGSIKKICRVVVRHTPEKYARNWKIETSTNDVDWTERASKTNYNARFIDKTFSFDGVGVDARYVRIYITADYAIDWDVEEIWIYEPDGNIAIEPHPTDLNEYGSPIKVRFDYENRLNALARLAKIIDWEFWSDGDDKLHFKQQRGQTRSITFASGSNARIISNETDRSKIRKKVILLGRGEGINQLKVERTAAGYQTGDPEIAVPEKDMIDTTAMEKRADAILADLKDPIQRIGLEVLDTASGLAFEVGDTVTVTDSNTGLSGQYRIHVVRRKWG